VTIKINKKFTLVFFTKFVKTTSERTVPGYTQQSCTQVRLNRDR